MSSSRLRSIFIAAYFCVSAGASGDAPTFNDLLPIFETNCSGCHASNVRMGSLDLDTWDAMMKGGNNGTIVVPGKSEESRLYLMVARKISPGMPLSGKTLASGEVETIRRYIDAGAPQPSLATLAKARKTVPEIAPSKSVHAALTALAWSPDSKLVAIGTFQQVRIVDPITSQTVATLRGEAEQVRAVAWSLDGKLIAAAGGLPGQRGEVKIWDAASKKETLTLKGHADCIYAAVFSPDGKTLATASYDNSVKVWNPETGERLYTMSEPTDGLNAVAISPKGDMLAAGGLDKTLRIWQLGDKSATLKATLIAHEDSILQLAWSPDGKTLISSSSDRTIKVFAVPALTQIAEFPKQSDWVTALNFAPDGTRFAAGRFDGTLQFYPAPK